MYLFRKRSLTLNSLHISKVIEILSFGRLVTVFVPIHSCAISINLPMNSSHAISTFSCSEIIDTQIGVGN